MHTMRDSLLDKCPVSSFAQVVQTLDEELGAPPSVLFAEFDPEPMASASLAQVRFTTMIPRTMFPCIRSQGKRQNEENIKTGIFQKFESQSACLDGNDLILHHLQNCGILIHRDYVLSYVLCNRLYSAATVTGTQSCESRGRRAGS